MSRFTFASSRARFLYLVLVLFVVLPVLLLASLSNVFWAAWVVEVDGPDLQRRFGFTAGNVSITAVDGRERTVFAITSVSDKGLFAVAGVKPGDVPVGYVHGFASGFYGDLLYARTAGTIELRLVAMGDVDRGWDAARTVTIRYPADDAAR